MTIYATSATDDVAQSATVSVDESLHVGLALLWRAYTYARDKGVERWDLALEIDNLYRAGMTISDLRWLVARGLAQHARETTASDESHRSFEHTAGFNFVETTCFVLTPKGAAIAQSSLTESGLRPTPTPSDAVAPVETHAPEAVGKPHWDAARRQLRLGETVVKRFRVPAPNQEIILSVFEEEDWPEQIDDPLPFNADIDPHTRLHDAINRLNRSQKTPLLRFHGNGNGTGVWWELCNPADSKQHQVDT